MTPDVPEILAASDVARLFRVDPKTVTRWANDGKIPSFRTLGGHRRYRRSDIEKVLGEAVQPRRPEGTPD